MEVTFKSIVFRNFLQIIEGWGPKVNFFIDDSKGVEVQLPKDPLVALLHFEFQREDILKIEGNLSFCLEVSCLARVTEFSEVDGMISIFGEEGCGQIIFLLEDSAGEAITEISVPSIIDEEEKKWTLRPLEQDVSVKADFQELRNLVTKLLSFKYSSKIIKTYREPVEQCSSRLVLKTGDKLLGSKLQRSAKFSDFKIKDNCKVHVSLKYLQEVINSIDSLNLLNQEVDIRLWFTTGEPIIAVNIDPKKASEILTIEFVKKLKASSKRNEIIFTRDFACPQEYESPDAIIMISFHINLPNCGNVVYSVAPIV
jgi:hypothetical protein